MVLFLRWEENEDYFFDKVTLSFSDLDRNQENLVVTQTQIICVCCEIKGYVKAAWCTVVLQILSLKVMQSGPIS